MVPTPITSLALSVYLCLLPLSVVGQFPQIGAQNALVVMNAMEVLEQKLIVLESKKELAIVTRAEHFRKALETFEDKQALIARGSLQFSDGTIIESNMGAGEQVIDPRTPVGLGDPLFRQIHVEQKIELASIMSPHQASELRAMIGPLQIEIVSGWKFLDGRGTLLQQNSNRHRTYFMSLVAVAPNKIIRRQCDSCKLSHQEIYYRRKDQSGVGGMHRKLLQMMLGDDYGFYSSDCGSGDTVCQIYNRCDIDFTLHSTYQDAIDNINPWQACRNVDFGTGVDMYTASNKIGFPGYSGISQPTSDQFNQGRTDNGQIDYGFFVEETKWEPIFGVGDLAIIGDMEAKNRLDAPAALRDSPHNILRRVCLDCTDDRYKDIYYRRIFPVPEDVDLWGIIDGNFKDQKGNVHKRDYEIHSTYSDAINAENGWYCGEDVGSTDDGPENASAVLYEAEDNLSDHSEKVIIKTEYVGYTGTAYVDIGPGGGSYAEWSNIDGGTGGICTLKLRYANGGTRRHRPGDLSINGNDMNIIFDFANNDSWETYTYEERETVCSAGHQTIRLTFNGPYGPNIDSIQVIFDPTPQRKLIGLRHLIDSEECLNLCCYPNDGSAVNDLMLSVCQDQNCHYEMANNGRAYCSVRNHYLQCVSSTCNSLDSTDPSQEQDPSPEQGSDSQGEESGDIGFPGRCRPHINDPVDTFEGQWIKRQEEASGVQDYAFYIEGESVPETGIWMTENDEMDEFLNPGSIKFDSEISCKDSVISVDTDSSASDGFATDLKPYTMRGQSDVYAGWYDVRGCGKCNDWCGWFSTDDLFDGGMNPRYKSWTGGNDMFACVSGSSLPDRDYTNAPSYIPLELRDAGSKYTAFLNFFPNIDRCFGAQENSPPVRNYEYLGCYMDAWDRALPRYIGGGISFDDCYESCRSKGYNLFGRQFLAECWCGGGGWNADANYEMYANVRHDRYDLSATNDVSSTTFTPQRCGDCASDSIGGWLMCTFRIIYETRRPREPLDGASLMCEDDPINIWRYTHNEKRLYPSVTHADLHDANWRNYQTINCYSIPRGVDMTMIKENHQVIACTDVVNEVSNSVKDEYPPNLMPYMYQMPRVSDPYAGYYDVQRCGKCNDYCFWAGPSQDGSGINPEWRTYTETDHFTCKLAEGSRDQYGMTERGYFGKSFRFQKCASEGDSTPAHRKREYVGCFYDLSSDRALPVHIGANSGVLTLEECSEACRDKGYHYFGRQEVGYCYCGGETVSDNSYAKHGEIGGDDFSVPRIDGNYREISKDIAGNFGVGDFTISMDVTGKGGELLQTAPGVIFVRSTQNTEPYAGPTAIISSNGDIQFRITNKRGGTFVWENAIPNPTGDQTRHLIFSRQNNILTIQVGDKSRKYTLREQIPGASIVTEAPLRFNANQQDTSLGRINIIMSNIRVSPIPSADNNSCSNCDGNNIGNGKQCVFKILDQYDPAVERKKHECSHIPSINVRRHCYVSCRDADLSHKNLLTCQTLKVTGLRHLNNEIAAWRDSPACDTKHCIKGMHPLGNDITQDMGTR